MNATASSLSPAELRSAVALAGAIIPGSATIPAADEWVVRHAEATVREFAPWLVKPWAMAQRALDAAAIARTGHTFSSLSPDRCEALLRAWEHDPLVRLPLGVLALVYKFVHFDRPEVFAAMGGKSNQVGNLDRPRWLAQVHRADEWQDDADIDCDVVVIGTGAGGAVVGRELAERGLAVVFVEEGEHYRRDAFDGSLLRAHQRFYRAAVSLGNVAIPIFIGRLVGGSTAINGGTCFRTPPWILDRWCEEIGTDAFTPEAMEPHFARVEERIQVTPAGPEIGPVRNVVARGCDKLGWSHFVVRRNVVGCSGHGFCDLGCGTDARRSTNLSYIPQALEAGAQLFTGLRCGRVLVEGGRATGIEGTTKTGRTLRVRGRAVVLAGGTVPTPMLLLEQGLANRSGQVGRNLTLHPSTGVSGLFDDDLDPASYTPQGYGVDQFLREGQLITVAQPTANVAAQIFQLTGRRLMDALDSLPHIGAMAVLIRDATANGRVWRTVGGHPAISYTVTPADRDRLHQGMVRIMELLVAAGAKRLYAARLSMPIIELDELARYRSSVPAAADLGLISYHPLGTCKMGKDPKTSVVGLDHQAHDVSGLYIVDGSTVPGPLGVNPQLTIMAMATRAAGHIAAALD